MSHDAWWEAENAKQLIGCTIVGIVGTPDGSAFGLLVTHPDWKGGDTAVWVDSDQEGNDCGHLSFSLEG